MTIIDLTRPTLVTAPRYLLAALLTLAMAIALAVVGAFGSYVTMGLPLRLLHFCASSFAINAVALIVLGYLRRYVFAGALPFWTTISVALATAPLGGLIVQQSLRLCAPQALRYVSFGELTGQVLLINLFIGTVTWALLRQPSDRAEITARDAEPAQVDAMAGEIRAKLPLPLRQAPIIALSAEDHYVRVRTDRGQALILMNLANAIAALGPDAGVRVHRSHWVSRALAMKTSDDRHGIRIDDDSVVPISRAGRKLLKELRKAAA
ncbi:MAG: LytTR family transcriptional regulator [Proteobacteria bacterium]|nr:LytTR family transcriptional regulator [Pseudomonadota bacterium]